MLLSSEPENRSRAEQLQAVFVDKNAPALADAIASPRCASFAGRTTLRGRGCFA